MKVDYHEIWWYIVFNAHNICHALISQSSLILITYNLSTKLHVAYVTIESDVPQ